MLRQERSHANGARGFTVLPHSFLAHASRGAMRRAQTQTRFDRLLRAVQLFVEYSDKNEQDRPSVPELLSEHEDLRDILSPMFMPGGAPSTGVSSLGLLDEQDPPPPSFVGPYRILKSLGRGASGVVYLAEQQGPIRRKIALKILQGGLFLPAEARTRFRAEGQALALMEHPSIAKVFDAGTTEDGQLYLAMEAIDGQTITEFCDRAGLGVEARIELFVGVCSAIQHAHQKGVIHRDLKPSNVLVALENGRSIPKVIDFGIAKDLDHQLDDSTLFTRCGQLLGTPEYMSPEQASLGEIDIDTRTDIYSLGVLLYELLVGCLPLGNKSERNLNLLIHDIRETDPLRPSAVMALLTEETQRLAKFRGVSPPGLARKLRDDLDWIVMKALEKDRSRRYGTVAELVGDLERHLRLEPILAVPPSVTYRTGKFLRRHRTVAALVCVFFLILTVSTTLFLFTILGEMKRAESNLTLANRRYEEVVRLSDVRRLQMAVDQADLLWPIHPKTVESLQDWLESAGSLASKLPSHRRKLADLDELVSNLPGPDVAGSPDAASGDLLWKYDTLSSLVAGLEEFTNPDPEKGLVASVRERLALSETLEDETLLYCADLWEDAVASIADPTDCPLYRGLSLGPQVGLIPIERNTDSGLWEFYHFLSGEAPEWGEDDRLMMTEEAGLIFVLLPGGEFFMGSQKDDPEEPNFDPLSSSQEGPVKTMTLDPFFVSKYELTQSQWMRWTGENPSDVRPGSRYLGKKANGTHPVEQVSWDECRRVLARYELSLPTEAQWEYAARGGTGTTTWAGDDVQSLIGTLNVADQSLARMGHPRERTWSDLNDGFAQTSPVGSYLPNPFGLLDVHGNVWEWCRDSFSSYQIPFLPGTGERRDTGATLARVVRGGSYESSIDFIRASARTSNSPEFRDSRLGVRPVRQLEKD